jgi:ankyrin repeat protein
LEAVVLLLEGGAEVNGSGSGYHGRTALQAAAENGHVEVVRVLVERGATVDDRAGSGAGARRGGWTALRMAIDNGYEEAAGVLRRAGAREGGGLI